MIEMKRDLAESIELLSGYIENVMKYCEKQVKRNEAANNLCLCCQVDA